jgi:hypothetical protein
VDATAPLPRPGGYGATRRGVFRAKDGGWVFGAQAGVKGGVHDGIVRTDASGHIACDDAGGCAKTATDACDDDNACTVDWCDAKSGCAHLPLSGVACPGGTCSAGTCK